MGVSAIPTEIADHPIPVAHQFKVLLAGHPGPIFWIARIPSGNYGRDLYQLHASLTGVETIGHNGILALAPQLHWSQ
jgi:hypothetical protein